MHSLILALSLLAPNPGADPAPPSYQVPVDSKVQGPDGRTYHFQGVLTLTVEEPAPVPVPPTITALKNEQGQGVLQVKAGEVLVIEGTKLWQEGANLRVQIPGRTATVLSFSPERVRVRFPAITLPLEGPLQLYWNQGSGWTLIATGPRITVLPGANPPGVPRIRSFKGKDGRDKRTFLPGESITLTGEGFGQIPGQVWLSQWPAPVLQWSDTEVRVAGYPWATVGQPAWESLWVQLWTAEGLWADTFSREFDPVVAR